MKRSDVVAELEKCVAGGSNWVWFGARALEHLPANGTIDPRLVERVMRRVFPYQVSACRRLPAAYVPIALRVLAKTDDADATVLLTYLDGDTDPARLHAAAAWLREADRVDPRPKNRARLAALVRDPRGLAAACAAVARHGMMADTLLAVLGHDGGDVAIDAMVEAFGRAIARRDKSLDDLATCFVPFARGPRMTALAAEVTAAIAARGRESPLVARFGTGKLELSVSIDSVAVYQGLSRKAGAWIVLSSHALPSIAVSVSWRRLNNTSTRWEDGRKIRDELKLGMLRGLDDLPRWLAAAAATLKIRWDPATIRVTSTLRGKAREMALDWLLGRDTMARASPRAPRPPRRLQ